MPTKQAYAFSVFAGILITALFAWSSIFLAAQPWFAHLGISATIIAIVLGMVFGNTFYHHLPVSWTTGVRFAAKRLLRIAIVLYGFRVTLQQIASIGIEGLILDSIVVTSTLLLGFWLGVKLLKIDRHLAILIAVGSAICGAAAVLAAEGVLKSEPYKAAIAVATVVVFGTLAMFLYPLLQHAGLFGFNNAQFGLFAGASVHEVAQALVTGNAINPPTGNTAVIVKMTRVLLLIPALLILSWFENKVANTANTQKTRLTVPWFAILFALVIAFNSLHLLPNHFISFLNNLDTFLLTMAMCAVGIETNFAKIKHVGLKPLYLASGLFIWLTLSVLGMIKLI